ncbi:MAG: hypothetical protein ACREMY_29305, partial [bacterium]
MAEKKAVSWIIEPVHLAGCFSILLGRLLRFVEHKVHDDHHGPPEDDLLMPKEDFSIVEENSG